MGSLPKFADPQRLADLLTELEGEVDLGTLARLQELAPGNDGRASVWLSFRRDEMKRVVMNGRAAAPLVLVCQRCGAPFVDQIEAAWEMVFAHSEDDERSLADQGLDVWYHDGPVEVAEILEEELMLALPMAPRHVEDCEPQQGSTAAPHPFAALVGLFERDLPNK
ncbi:MAG TPA: YceD family protein [Acidiferrobacter sp.]|nr:YceD family protein [Acidiferrobacter sp.]